MTAAFYILLSVYANATADTIKVSCADLVCVGKVVEASRARPEIRRIRVFTEEPGVFGGGQVWNTPALADYQGS